MKLADVTELRRLPAPAPFPQALGFDGTSLWVSSRETRRLYAIDPNTGSGRDEGEAPGTPWGLTVTGDELRVVCGEPPDDNRFIRRFVPGHGFAHNERIACPDDTGSYLGYDGERLLLTQWYRRRILALDDTGRVGTVIDVPHDICGCVVVGGRIYLLTTDDEETTDYWLTRVDARGASPAIDDLGRVPFPGRSLAFDGTAFWTNHRAAHEIVAFAPPSGAFDGATAATAP